MKRLCILVCIVGAYSSMAQPASGNKFVGGSLSFTTNKYEQGTGNPDYTESEFTIAPSGGYFISDNIALGLNLSFMNGKDDDGTGVDKYSEFAIGPFAQFYKPINESSFSFLAEAGFLYGMDKFSPDGGGELKGNSMTVYVSPGFTYFFSKSWALDFKLRGIAFSSSDPNTDGAAEGDKESYFTFGASSFNPSIGFRFIF